MPKITHDHSILVQMPVWCIKQLLSSKNTKGIRIKNNPSLFVLILAKEKITISMKILKAIIWVLAAWNNHRG